MVALVLYACGRVGYEDVPPVAAISNGGAGDAPSADGGAQGASTGGASPGTGGGSSGGVGSGGTNSSGGSGAGGVALDASADASGGAAEAGGGAAGAGGGTAGAGGHAVDSGPTDAGCGTVRCDPWWDSSFTRRRKLTFDQTLHVDDVNGLSVLVRLDSTRIDYGATENLGQDLRFIDDDGITALPHEVERWDEGGTSIVWVRVPRIEGATDLDHVWMYYGNPTAPDGQQRSAVWSGYDAVYHLDGFDDSTGKQPAAIDRGTTVAMDGIGHARELDGIAAYVDLGSNLPLLQNVSAVTLSLRVRVRSVVGERALISNSVNSTLPTGLSRSFLSFVNAADVRAGGRARDVDPTSSFLTTTGSPMSVGTVTWQHIAAVMDLAGQEILLFVDGVPEPTDAISLPFGAAVTDGTPTSFNVLGASDDMASQYLDGTLDEVRIAPERRSPAWVEADARSQRDGLIRFGAEERF